MPRAQPVIVDDAMLRAAWAHCRRTHWPSSFEATMADRMLAGLVRCEAIRRELAARRAGTTAGHYPPVPAAKRPHRHSPHHVRAATAPRQLDRKRLAAADFDDDDTPTQEPIAP